jgi:heat shock protein HslJ
VNLSLDVLKNAQFTGIYDDTIVQLSDGYYEGEPFVEGAASRPTVTLIEPYAFGDLDGDGTEDASLLLVESSGGSGSFVYLAAMLNQDGQPVNAATHFLSDRARPQAMTIAGGIITIDMVAHGPEDPMCCPSLRVIETYQLQGEALSLLSREEKATTDLSDLVDVTWKWMGLVVPDGQSEINVRNCDDYLLEFADDGTYTIKADCNRGFGDFSVDGDAMTIAPPALTRAACPPGSLDQRYLEFLGLVESYTVQDTRLLLKLQADSPSMQFAKHVSK